MRFRSVCLLFTLALGIGCSKTAEREPLHVPRNVVALGEKVNAALTVTVDESRNRTLRAGPLQWRWGAPQLSIDGWDLWLGHAEVVTGVGGTTARWPEIEERFDEVEAGLEHSLVFARAPGLGSLNVRIETADMFLGSSAQGLAFAHRDGPAVLHYGHATWVDAVGHRTPIESRYVHGAIELTVSDEVVATSVFPATLDPLIGVAFDVDVVRRGLASTASVNQLPTIGVNGSETLIIWGDTRNGGQVLAMPFDNEGNPLSASPTQVLPISLGWAFDVTGIDGGYYFVWTQTGTAGYDIFGMPLALDGQPQVDAGIVICDAPGDQRNPSVTFNGSMLLVGWDDLRNGTTNTDAYAARVSLATGVLDPNGFALHSGQYHQMGVDVAQNGSVFFAVWFQDESPFVLTAALNGRVFGARISPASGLIDTTPIAIAPFTLTQERPSVASNGTDFLVAFQDWRNNPVDVYAARVNSSGTVLDPTGFSVASFPNYQQSARVMYDGQNYVVSWSDARSGTNAGYMARVSSSGTVLDPGGIALATGRPVAAAVNIGPSIRALTYPRPNNPDLVEFFSDGGISLKKNWGPLISAADSQTDPAADFNGQHHLVAWLSIVDAGSADVRATRVTFDGVLDPTSQVLSDAGVTLQPPMVASNGSGFLVVWSQNAGSGIENVVGVRLNAQGQIQSPSPFPIAANGQRNSAYDLTYSQAMGAYFVVWLEGYSGSTSSLRGARVLADGTVMDPNGLQLLADASELFSVFDDLDIAATSTGAVLTYVTAPPLASDTVWATRLSSSGAVLDMPAVQVYAGGASEPLLTPMVVSTGGQVAIAWSTHSRLWVRRFSESLVPLDDAGISLAQGLSRAWLISLSQYGADALLTYGDYDTGHVGSVAATLSPVAVRWSEVILVDPALLRTTPVNDLTVSGLWPTLMLFRRTYDSSVTVENDRVKAQLLSFNAPDGSVTSDAGSTDAGSTDAGGTDAEGTDAGGTDAGGTDAGGTDAGGTDAGGIDPGSPDAGSTDSGVLPDGGIQTNGSLIDGGGSGGRLEFAASCGAPTVFEVTSSQTARLSLPPAAPSWVTVENRSISVRAPSANDEFSFTVFADDGNGPAPIAVLVRVSCPRTVNVGCDCGATGGGGALFPAGCLVVWLLYSRRQHMRTSTVPTRRRPASRV